MPAFLNNFRCLTHRPTLCYAPTMNTLLGQRIRALRVARGLRSCDMARGVGISQEHAAHIEFGREHPSDAVLRRIAKLLRTDYTELRNLNPHFEQDLKDWARSDPGVRKLLRGIKDSGLSPAFVVKVLVNIVQDDLAWTLDPPLTNDNMKGQQP